MYWICLTREELDALINVMKDVTSVGHITDEAHELRKKLEFFREHDDQSMTALIHEQTAGWRQGMALPPGKE